MGAVGGEWKGAEGASGRIMMRNGRGGVRGMARGGMRGTRGRGGVRDLSMKSMNSSPIQSIGGIRGEMGEEMGREGIEMQRGRDDGLMEEVSGLSSLIGT